jgi:hypothetical protein
VDPARKRAFAGLILATTIAGISVGTAMANGADSPEPLTREQVYTADMTLKEVQAAATGKAGELAPPCPDEKTALRLKAANLAFGPCDLVPEDGSPVILADPNSEPSDADAAVCPATTVGKDSELTASIPCARGAKITAVRAVTVDGAACATVTYVARTGASPRSETDCPGDGSAANSATVNVTSESDHAHE